MKTRQAPWDYVFPKAIKPQKVKLCDECGANMYYRDGYRCYSCPNTSYVIVYEHEAANFRLDLMEAQERKAAMIATDCLAQMDVFLELTGEALNLDAGTETLLNSWIEENERLYPDGSDNRPSSQWLEHGYH